MSVRISNINFSDVQSNFYKYSAYKDNNGEFVYKKDKADLDNLIKNSSMLVVEPTLIVRFSLIEALKVQLQATPLLQLSNSAVPVKDNNFSVGIQLLLPAEKDQ